MGTHPTSGTSQPRFPGALRTVKGESSDIAVEKHAVRTLPRNTKLDHLAQRFGFRMHQHYFHLTMKTTLKAVSLAHNLRLEQDAEVVLTTIRTILERQQWRLLDLEGSIPQVWGEKVTQLLDESLLESQKLLLQLPPWFPVIKKKCYLRKW